MDCPGCVLQIAGGLDKNKAGYKRSIQRSFWRKLWQIDKNRAFLLWRLSIQTIQSLGRTLGTSVENRCDTTGLTIRSIILKEVRANINKLSIDEIELK